MISARRPFARDEELFDYDYDSDAEYVEEEQGESLSDIDDELVIDFIACRFDNFSHLNFRMMNWIPVMRMRDLLLKMDIW